LNAVVEEPGEACPFPDAHFDALLALEIDPDANVLRDRLTRLAPSLNPRGYLMLRAPAPPDETATEAADTVRRHAYDRILEAARDAGFGLYHRAPLARGRGVPPVIEAGDGDAPAGECLLVLVRPDYNPLEHAEALFDAGRPDSAFEVLALIPAVYLQETDVRINVRALMQLCLLSDLKRRADLRPLDHFDKAQELFHQLVFDRPDFAPAYQCQAEFWRLLGDRDMARRLLRSAQRVAPSDAVARQIGALPPPPETRAAAEAAPDWAPAGRAAPRVLFVLHPRPHYGLDVLYDGLCATLGDNNVVEFPYKPSLHGAPPEEYKEYPCTFDRPGRPVALEELLDQLAQGEFDVVLYGDCEANLPRETAHAIARAAGNTPLFIVDALDAAMDLRARVMDQLGVASVAGYFKREMLRCVDYGPNAFPLPFAYPDCRVAPAPGATPRPRQFFWAGHRQSGLRRLFLERIEARLGVELVAGYPQEQYLTLLHESRVGLNCFGFGFDTVRYWELPAHGVVLFSERLPIRIPFDFVDGESAVFFGDLEEMETKLDRLLASPDECARIAAAGRAQLLRHH
ncbi:MAG TPA: glycosyltransferase, partial [Candidatus Hydrogenedentes bacterium]|nr:glycosyltransferase [Candidatus Hydrogenedentota bacterium]